VPVIKHLDGNCHVYVDAQVDLELALPREPTTRRRRSTAPAMRPNRCWCTATLPPPSCRAWVRCGAQGRRDALRCGRARAAAAVAGLTLAAASEQDWNEEYLAPVISVKLVADLDEAIAHINRHGSHHTDAILTEHHGHAMRFLREVDSASVMVNASTRFADGFEYGLGAEIGISTDKFHARGPSAWKGSRR